MGGERRIDEKIKTVYFSLSICLKASISITLTGG
jgi:hypothetical protein